MFNIVLAPKNKKQNFIALAQDLIKKYNLQADYLLSDVSFPHITLTQFRVDDNFNFDLLLNKIKEIKAKEFTIKLQNIHYKLQSPYIWLQMALLNPTPCHALHQKIIAILKDQNITCINKHSNNYNPHLTLARVKTNNLPDLDLIPAVNIEDNFQLAFAKGDEIGQVKEIIDLL